MPRIQITLVLLMKLHPPVQARSRECTFFYSFVDKCTRWYNNPQNKTGRKVQGSLVGVQNSQSSRFLLFQFHHQRVLGACAFRIPAWLQRQTSPSQPLEVHHGLVQDGTKVRHRVIPFLLADVEEPFLLSDVEEPFFSSLLTQLLKFCWKSGVSKPSFIQDTLVQEG